MVNEQTSDAIVNETTWLTSGQPTMLVSTEDRGCGPGKDEYNRPMLDWSPTQAPMGHREASELARLRARTWDFKAPNAPKKPDDFIPWREPEEQAIQDEIGVSSDTSEVTEEKEK